MRILLAAVLLLTPAVAFAGGYIIPNTNPRDMALSETTVSSTEGAEATYVNASTLADHAGLRITLAGNLINFTSTWHDPANPNGPGVTTLNHYSPTVVAAASYGFRLGKFPVGVGASLNIPAGVRIGWPSSWPGSSEIISVDRRMYQTTVGVGVRLLPQLTLGLSGIYMRTTEDLVQGLPFGTTQGTAEVTTAGGEFSFAFSLLLTPIKNLNIGFNYQNLASQTLNGHVHFENVPPAFQTTAFDQSIRHQLTFPNIFTVGASYNIEKIVRVLFAYQLDRFIVYREDLFQGSAGVNVTVARNYHNENTYRLGAEILAIPHARIFLGGRRDITPQPTSTISPTLPDSSSWGVMAGAAWDVIPQLSVLVGYEHDFFDQVQSTGPDAFPAIYNNHANLLSIGVQGRLFVPKEEQEGKAD